MFQLICLPTQKGLRGQEYKKEAVKIASLVKLVEILLSVSNDAQKMSQSQKMISNTQEVK